MNDRGLTLLEVTIGAAVFSLVILGGVVTTRLSMNSVKDSVVRTATLNDEGDIAEDLDRIFTPVGFSTLAYDPNRNWKDPTQAVLQPLPEGVAADHVAFRRVVGANGFELVYEPPEGKTPCTLYLYKEPYAEQGNLVYFDGESTLILATNVLDVSLVRRDTHLEATILVTRRATAGDLDVHEVERLLRFRLP